MLDIISVKGDLKVVVYDESGSIKDTRDVNNLVVTAGKAHIADRLSSNTAVVMSHMAVGSSNVAPAITQTALSSELARVALDSTATSNATTTYVATFPAGVATGTLKEAGIFNDANVGTMLCRTQFSDITKSISDTVVITWNVTVQ